MTREEAKTMLPFIQAYAEGKAIESRCIKGDKSLWYDDEDPSFDDDFEYRIKPESEYRPFANAKECWEEMMKHQPFGWTIDKAFPTKECITNVISEGIVYGKIVSKEDIMSFEAVFNYFKFADGTPFGVKVEE